MNNVINKTNLPLADDEIKILDTFRTIPEDKQNEAIIKLYILAENSSKENEH